MNESNESESPHHAFVLGIPRVHICLREQDWRVANDYRLQLGSPAVDAGVELPADWPDPLRKLDQGKPDFGAFPLGAGPFQVGRTAVKPDR